MSGEMDGRQRLRDLLDDSMHQARAMEVARTELLAGAGVRTDGQPDGFLRILVVDDNAGFLAGIQEEAASLNKRGKRQLALVALNPITAEQVIQAIADAKHTGQSFDLILLDYELRGEVFTAKHVLAALNKSSEPFVKYLPRLVITNHASHGQTFASFLLGLGADGVHLYKGGQVKPERYDQPTYDAPQSDYAQVLRALLNTEFAEIQVRAWTRMWRNIHNRVESVIASQRQHPCLGLDHYKALLGEVWDSVAKRLTGNNYAARANLRIFDGDRLISIGTADQRLLMASALDRDWKHLPYVKRWLELAVKLPSEPEDWVDRFSDFYIKRLTTEEINDAELAKFLEGRQAVAMPLFTHHGPIGLLTLIREQDASDFALTDWEQMLAAGLRLAMHAQDLHTRWQTHERTEALVKLQRDLSNTKTDEEALYEALRTVHKALLNRVQGLHGSPAMPPATGVDPSGRTTVRRIDPDMKWSGWGIGLGIGDGLVATRLNVLDSKRTEGLLVHQVIVGREPLFYADTQQTISRYKPPSPGANRCLMHAPVIIDEVPYAIIAVGHAQPAFFGPNAEQSTDFQFLKECAEVLGHALSQQRSAHLQSQALDLLLKLSNEHTDKDHADSAWGGHVAQMLVDYTVGCRAALWLTPNRNDLSKPWRVAHAWEAERRSDNVLGLVPSTADRLAVLTKHMDDHWSDTFISRASERGQPLVSFTDSQSLRDTAIGVGTASQLNLRIALTTEAQSLAMLVLLFTVKVPLHLERHRDFLDRLARLCAVYLQDRQRLLELGSWQTLAKRNQDMADAFVQMRHQLRSQLADVDEGIKRCLRKLEEGYGGDPSSVANSVRELQTRLLSRLPHLHHAMDLNGALTREVHITRVVLSALAEKALEGAKQRADILGVRLASQVPLVATVHADRDFLALVLGNLLDNALDEFELQAKGHSGRPLRAESDPAPEITLSLVRGCKSNASGNANALFHFLVVADNGPGVLASRLPSLFDGISNKPLGSGFQLKFCALLLQRLGFGLQHQVNIPNGAKFLISMPDASVQFG